MALSLMWVFHIKTEQWHPIDIWNGSWLWAVDRRPLFVLQLWSLQLRGRWGIIIIQWMMRCWRLEKKWSTWAWMIVNIFHTINSIENNQSSSSFIADKIRFKIMWQYTKRTATKLYKKKLPFISISCDCIFVGAIIIGWLVPYYFILKAVNKFISLLLYIHVWIE